MTRPVSSAARSPLHGPLASPEPTPSAPAAPAAPPAPTARATAATALAAAHSRRGPALRGPAAGLPAEARVQVAAKAVAELARAAGHPAAAFAARFAGPRHEGHDAVRLAAEARYAFVRETLTRAPGLAPRLIEARLQGASVAQRALVQAVLSRSGEVGLRRYELAERSLVAARGFDAEQLGDLTGLVRAGATLGAAVDAERAELRRVAAQVGASPAAPAPPPDLRAGLTAMLAAQQQRVHGHERRCAGLVRAAGSVTRGAELSVGLLNASGTVGAVAFGALESAVARNGALGSAVTQAGEAAGHLLGELTDAQTRLRGHEAALRRAVGAYDAQAARALEDVRERGQLAPATSRELARLEREVVRVAQALEPAARELRERQGSFDAATKSAARGLVVSAVFQGVGWARGGGASAAELARAGARELAQGAARELGQAAVQAVPEAGAARLWGAAAEGVASEREPH